MRGLAAEIEAGGDDLVWRADDGRALTLVATEAALAAIGVEPASAAQNRNQAQEPGHALDAGAGDDRATESSTGAQGGDGPKVRPAQSRRR